MELVDDPRMYRILPDPAAGIRISECAAGYLVDPVRDVIYNPNWVHIDLLLHAAAQHLRDSHSRFFLDNVTKQHYSNQAG